MYVCMCVCVYVCMCVCVYVCMCVYGVRMTGGRMSYICIFVYIQYLELMYLPGVCHDHV
jgi:hypothetical protein